jgi:hypothetical protein
MLRNTGPAGRALTLVLAFAGLSVLAGCYTVLKHPRTAEVVDGGEMARDCYSCHGPAGPASPFDPLYTPGFDYYPDAWYGYYAYPWWWRDYWHDDIYGHGGSGGGIADIDDDGRRYLWGRGGSYSPPSLPPVYSAPGLAAPGAGPGAGSGGGSAPPPAQSDQQPGRTMKNSDAGTGTGTGTPPPPAPADDSKKKDDPTVGGRGQSSDGGGRSKKD